MHNFQAMMLKGAEMETLEARRTFRFDTRFRVLPKNFGLYDGKKVFDIEEIIVATDTLPFEDYIAARKWHLVSSVFWNDGWFEPVVRFARAHGVKNSEWWSCMLPALENDNGAVRGFLDNFVAETKGELFHTPQECVDYYSQAENFRKLENGEIGDNLMYRYRAIASFYLWDEACLAAMGATRRLLVERGARNLIVNFDQFWEDFTTYIRLTHASGRDRTAILAPRSAPLLYDFPAWLAQEEIADPTPFRLPEPRAFEFCLTPDAQEELDRALQVWTTHIKGLSKLVTRIKVDSQVRQCTPRKQKREPYSVAGAGMM